MKNKLRFTKIKRFNHFLEKNFSCEMMCPLKRGVIFELMGSNYRLVEFAKLKNC